MITKEKFVKYLGVICDTHKEYEKMYRDVSEIFGDCNNFIEVINIDAMIKMLADWAEDTDGWIYWYVLEKECGARKDMVVRDNNGDIIRSDTYEDIWNIIAKGESNSIAT